jgi:hypothetical protein
MSRINSRHWVYLLIHLVIFAVGVLLVRSRGSVASGVGAALVATALAGWILFVWVLVNQEQARRLDVLASFGLVDAFMARSAQIKSNYDVRLAGARQAIDIMGFGLRHLREDYVAEFQNWASRARVRILLMDPDVPDSAMTNASQRDLEEGNPSGSTSADVKAFLESTASLRIQYPDRFQVRLYTALPSINIFRVDDELFWGPYLVNRQSRNTPTFLIRRGGALFNPLLEHFEELWSNEVFSHDPRPTPEAT